MARLVMTLLGVGICLLPVLLVVVAVWLLALVRRPRWCWYNLSVTVLIYLLLAGGLALVSYTVVPADYTRLGKWTWQPAAKPLAESHAVRLERAALPGYAPPETAAAMRAGVVTERQNFVLGWVQCSSVGLLVVLVGLLWQERRVWFQVGS